MSLEENIKYWVQLDNDIKQLTANIKKLRLEKDMYNNSILEYIAKNNLDNAIVKICNGTLQNLQNIYNIYKIRICLQLLFLA